MYSGFQVHKTHRKTELRFHVNDLQDECGIYTLILVHLWKYKKACFDTKGEQIRSDESHTWSTICTHLYFSSNIIITSSRKHNSLWTWNKFKRGKSANIAFKYIFATCFLLSWSWYYTIVEYFVTLISSFCNLSKKNIKYVVCIIV